MNERVQLVVFRVDDQRYALPLASVDHIIRAVAVTPLPGAPATVVGAIDVRGRVLPVLSMRRRFLLPEREIGPADHFLIARSAGRAMALVIDEPCGVIERDAADLTGAGGTMAGFEGFQGLVKLDDGLALIHDLEKALSVDEARTLDDALNRAA